MTTTDSYRQFGTVPAKTERKTSISLVVGRFRGPTFDAVQLSRGLYPGDDMYLTTIDALELARLLVKATAEDPVQVDQLLGIEAP